MSKTGMVWNADLNGEDGNAWVIMGVTRKIIKQTLGKEEADEYSKRAKESDYENLLKVTREYITIKDSPAGYYEEEDEDDDAVAEAYEAVKIEQMGKMITTLINSLEGKEKADLIEVLRSTLEGSDD